MAKVTDAILKESAFSRGATAPMLDISFGGQNGLSNNLVEWNSNQAAVRRNVSCILLEAPLFFQKMPDPKKWVQSLKSCVELHARSIEGLNAGLKVQFAEHAIGGAGEMQQEITKVTRDRTEVVFGYYDKYGSPIQTLHEMWILYGMADPDTNTAMVGTLEGDRPGDLLAEWNTMSCLFFEADALHRKVQKAWVVTNMMPQGTGDIIGKRDVTAAAELVELSIPYTGIAQYNLGARKMAQQILDAINLTNANPYLRPAFITAVHADVAAENVGMKKEIEAMAAQTIAGPGRR